MCTTLAYTDANGAVYLGRTSELDVEEPWSVAYVPAGGSFRSQVPDQEPFEFSIKWAFIAATPTHHIRPDDLKATEGLNEAGVTYSLLAYPSTPGDGSAVERTKAALDALDLGAWILGSHSSVAEARAALDQQPIHLTKLKMVGNAEFPFHAVVHDRTGASIVIEWDKGEQRVYDNPVNVMTNGPAFAWHLTNLRNWTHLSNVDNSSATFGALHVTQPDSGIATAALPSSNTSVGRFIRAVYYSNFAEKVTAPDQAMLTLARIMNNFDRPRNITVDLPDSSGESITIQGTSRGGPPTEYTTWTNLSDLHGGQFFLRTYDAFNYTMFDLGRLTKADGLRALPTASLDPLGGDGTDSLLAGIVASPQ